MSTTLQPLSSTKLSTDDQYESKVPVVSIRLVSYNDSGRSTSPLPFEPIERNLVEGVIAKVGRQVNRPNSNNAHPASKESIWFQSKVVSRNHAEIWAKDCQVYLKDVGSSSGTFLNRMRLSPSNKESRPYPLKDGDVIQLGIDYQGRTQDIFKCVIIKIQITNRTYIQQRRKTNPARFMSALRALLSATNPYSTSVPGINEPVANNSIDCCICLCHIGPFQALFIAPCSHCFHYKCINPILSSGDMFLCPVCRQVANLNASVSSDSLFDNDEDEMIECKSSHEDMNGSPESPSLLSATPITTISNITNPTQSLISPNSMSTSSPSASNFHLAPAVATAVTTTATSSAAMMSTTMNNDISPLTQQVQAQAQAQAQQQQQQQQQISSHTTSTTSNSTTPIFELQNMHINEAMAAAQNENITEGMMLHTTEAMSDSIPLYENTHDLQETTSHYASPSPAPASSAMVESMAIENDHEHHGVTYPE